MLENTAVRARLGRLRRAARRRLRPVPDPAVAHAAALAAALERGSPPDVLYLADSTAAWASPEDRDTRSLPSMIGDLLPGRTLMVLADGGYHLGLFARYVSVVSRAPCRPGSLVISLCLRPNSDTWLYHPRYGYASALRLLDREIEGGRSLASLRARLPRASSAEWAAFRSRPHRTGFGPRLTVGEHLDALTDPELANGERSRLLHLYHNGVVLHADDDGVRAAHQLGRQCGALAVPVVAYQNPVNVETLVEHWGEEARTSVEEGFRVLTGAFVSGVREARPDLADVVVLEIGTTFAAEEFIDPDDATEHLNEQGRRHLAEGIAVPLGRLFPA